MTNLMRNNRTKRIGVFDSGFGGINVLRGIVKELPRYSYLYLGDTARTPYGTRSKSIIYEFTRQAVDFLFANDCELIMFACNTASSDALRKIQREYLPKRHLGKKVLGCSFPPQKLRRKKPSTKKLVSSRRKERCLSNAFVRELTKLDRKIKVFQNACPLLVPIVEAGEENSPAAQLMLEKYLLPLKKKKIDALILGCTHYGILERQIKKIVGGRVAVISEADIVPKKLRDYLARHPEIEKQLKKNKTVRFCSTDLTDKFARLGGRFFGKRIKVKKVVLK